MRFNFSYYFFNFVFFLFIVSCSNERLVKMGVVKKKTNQFSVSRKAPLEMPPDMYLRPPKSENNSNLNNEEISLDEILANKKVSEKNKDKELISKELVFQVCP